jgi:hypothetical protein
VQALWIASSLTPSSLRVERSNPALNASRPWIASSLALLDLTNVRSAILGDRWEGELKIAGNAITIVTTRNGPADDSARPPATIIAQRP